MKKSHMDKFNSVYTSSNCYYGMELRPEFTDYFKRRDISEKIALDLGCGEGRYALYLAKRGCRVTAIDRSRAGICKLKYLAKKQQVVLQAQTLDIKDFVFLKDHYDIIIAATLLDHLANNLRSKTIDNIKASLSPGGILYANVFTVSDPGFRINKNSRLHSSRSGISDTAVCIEHYFAEGELRSVFRELEVLYYYEGTEPDLSHGRPHHHGWACLLARRPAT